MVTLRPVTPETVSVSLPNLKTFAKNLSRFSLRRARLLYKVNRRASEFGKAGNLQANYSRPLNSSPSELPAIGHRVFLVESENFPPSL